jgi:transcriptional regulator with XRE-family HTH domain
MASKVALGLDATAMAYPLIPKGTSLVARPQCASVTSLGQKYTNGTLKGQWSMTPIQFRMARAALGLTVRELAERAGVHKNTILRIEGGLASHGPTIAAVRHTLEAAGLEFIQEEQGVGGPGVRLKWGVNDPVLASGESGRNGEGNAGQSMRHAWDECHVEVGSPAPSQDILDQRNFWAAYPERWEKLSETGKAVLARALGL